VIERGQTAEASLVVRFEDTAAALTLSKEDAFPRVFATARMVALMEVAAARLMRPLLEEGQLSVGVSVDVKHTAATPLGREVRAVATYLGPEGKLFRFKVEAFDAGGPVGAGEHTRAIVSTERLVDGAVKRQAERKATAAERPVLERLAGHVNAIGSANDCEDHGSREEAERMRADAAAAILAILAEHPFVAEMLPGLRSEVKTGHIYGFGWSFVEDLIKARLG
jgi:predicted thioesterase